MASSSERRAGDLNYPSASAIWLKDKIPAPLLVISVVVLPLTLYGFFGGLLDQNYGLSATLTLVILGPWALIYMNNKGPKVAWDENRVYMRASGWTFRRRFPWLGNLSWRSLGYDEIVSLDDMTLNDPAGSFLLPFQMLRLTAPDTTDDFDERHIWFYAASMRDKELAPLLRHIDAQCPGMLPDVVQKRLAKWADNDR